MKNWYWLLILGGLLVLVVKPDFSNTFAVLLGGGETRASFETGSSNKVLPYNGDDFRLETEYNFICTKAKLAELLPYSHFANEDVSPSSGYAEQYFQAPQPVSDCWEAKLVYNGKGVSMLDGKTIRMGPYVNMTFDAKGRRYVRFQAQQDLEVYLDEPKAEDAPDLDNYRADFFFEFSQEDFLTAGFKESEPVVRLNSVQFADVEVCNDFSNNIDGGLHVYYEREKLFRTPDHEKQFYKYKKGCQIIKVPLKTNELGVIKVTVQPFIIFRTQHVKRGCMVWESETDCDQYGWIPETYEYELVQTTTSSLDYYIGVNATVIIPEDMRCEDKPCKEGVCSDVPFINDVNEATMLKVCLKEQEITKGPLLVKENAPDLSLIIGGLIIITGIGLFVWSRWKK